MPTIAEFGRFQQKLLMLHYDRERYAKWPDDSRFKNEHLEEIEEKERDFWSMLETVFDAAALERFKIAWERTRAKKSRHKDTLYEEFIKLVPKRKSASNEAAIRQAAKAFLSEKFPVRTIHDEFSHWSLNARPDFVMADPDDRENPLIAVEVKSDRDTFERLHRQLVEYERLATGIYVALDARHYGGWIRKFESRFPRVGVLVYDGGKIEEAHRAVVRDPASIEWLDVLWGAELKAMLSPFRGRSKVPGNLRAMLEMIRAVYTPLEIEEMARAIFLRRLATGKPGGGALADIPGIETRQPLFDRALAALDRISDRIDRERFFAKCKNSQKEIS